MPALIQYLRTTTARLARDDRGGTAIEYSLIAVLIAVACIASFKMLGGNTSGNWGNTATKAGNAMNGS